MNVAAAAWMLRGDAATTEQAARRFRLLPERVQRELVRRVFEARGKLKPDTFTESRPSPYDGAPMQVTYFTYEEVFEHDCRFIPHARRRGADCRPRVRRGHRRATATRGSPDDSDGGEPDPPNVVAAAPAGGAA